MPQLLILSSPKAGSRPHRRTQERDFRDSRRHPQVHSLAKSTHDLASILQANRESSFAQHMEKATRGSAETAIDTLLAVVSHLQTKFEIRNGRVPQHVLSSSELQQ